MPHIQGLEVNAIVFSRSSAKNYACRISAHDETSALQSVIKELTSQGVERTI